MFTGSASPSHFVGLEDYQNLNGFGLAQSAQLDNLSKALSAGFQNPPADGGSALRVESLERTLKVVTFMMEHIKFWKKIPKSPAYSTVEEYNRLTQYGGEGGGFISEGALSLSADSDYTRHSQLVKFMGTTREVTHPMTLVRPAHGNVIAQETQNGAMWILERLERALFEGDAGIIEQEFNGVHRQILEGIGDPSASGVAAGYNASNSVVIDLRGAPLTEGALEEGANRVVENFGVPTDLYLSTRSLSELAKTFFPKERVQLPAPAEGKVGLALNSFVSQAGLIEFNPDVFLRARRRPPAQPNNGAVPATPTLVAVAGAGLAVTGSKFTAADDGTYIYQATAVNEYGESAPATSAGFAFAIAANLGMNVTITDGGNGVGVGGRAAPAMGYRVYRSRVNAAASTAEFVAFIPRGNVRPANKSAGTTTWTDLNHYLPGTSKAFLLQNNAQNIEFRQLAPMMKLPLATVSSSIRWMQLLYGTPILYTPLKNVIFINIGESVDSFTPNA